MQDLYEVLKITPTATMTEVEAAYNQLYSYLSREAEYGGKNVKNQLFLVKRAYRILSDHESRCVYDLEWEFNSFKNPSSFIEARRMKREDISKSEWERIWMRLRLSNIGPASFNIWSLPSFQWALAILSILTPVLILIVIRLWLNDFKAEKAAELNVPFLNKVGISSDSLSNNLMTIREFETAWSLLKEEPLHEVKTDSKLEFRPIALSNAARCGLIEWEILEFFSQWSLAQSDSSKHENLAVFYNEMVEFMGEEMSKEELVFKKMAVYKTRPTFGYFISSTVMFERLLNEHFSLKYINFAGNEIFNVRAGYVEFIQTEMGPKITKEEFY